MNQHPLWYLMSENFGIGNPTLGSSLIASSAYQKCLGRYACWQDTFVNPSLLTRKRTHPSTVVIQSSVTGMQPQMLNHFGFKDWLLKKGEQIVGTQEKSQQLVSQRILACLQYLDATKSSAKDLSFLWISLWLVGVIFVDRNQPLKSACAISFHVATRTVSNIA